MRARPDPLTEILLKSVVGWAVAVPGSEAREGILLDCILDDLIARVTTAQNQIAMIDTRDNKESERRREILVAL